MIYLVSASYKIGTSIATLKHMVTPQTFAQSFDNGFRATLRLLLSKGIHSEEAEEFAQAAWSRGWEARHQLKDPSKIISWINGIAMHLMCSEKRRAKRHGALDEAHAHSQITTPVLEKLDAGRLLKRCSELDRSLLIHRYAGGMEMNEIAQKHGMTCVATRVRIHRSKTALRQFALARPVAA